MKAVHEEFLRDLITMEEIVFQKTHLPLSFRQTMQVFSRLTAKRF